MKIFDAHFHIIDNRFPLVPNNGFVPQEFTTENYRQATKEYNIVGGAIVSGSFQAFGQEYLKFSLKEMTGHFVGVANIPFTASDEYLLELDQCGIRAVRFNLKRGGSETVQHLDTLSNRAYDLHGWHTELYVDTKELKTLKSSLEKIPNWSIDHLGLSKQGLDDLYYWVGRGVKVKATGFGRINFDPVPVMKTIYSINPGALMFGTDLPSTRAQKPFTNSDVLLIKDNFSIADQKRIFWQNAFDWYMSK